MNSNPLSSAQAGEKIQNIPSLRFALLCNAFLIIGFVIFYTILLFLTLCWRYLSFYISIHPNNLNYFIYEYIIDNLFFVSILKETILLLLFFGIGYLLTKHLPKDWLGVNWKKCALRSYAIGSIMATALSLLMGRGVPDYNRFFMGHLAPDYYSIIYFFPAPIILLFNNTKTGERLWHNILTKFLKPSHVSSAQVSSAQADNKIQKIPTIRIILFCNTFILIGFILFSAIVFSSFIGCMLLQDFLSNKQISPIYYDPDSFLLYIIKILPTILITSLAVIFLFVGIGYLLTKLLPKDWRGVDLKKIASTSYSNGSIKAIIALSYLASTIGLILPSDLILYIIFFSLTPALLLFNNTNAGELAWQNIWSKFRRKKTTSNPTSHLS